LPQLEEDKHTHTILCADCHAFLGHVFYLVLYSPELLPAGYNHINPAYHFGMFPFSIDFPVKETAKNPSKRLFINFSKFCV
jgi:hypothetical protein